MERDAQLLPLAWPRVTVKKVLYRGISCHLSLKRGDRFRLSRYSYSTKKKIATKFAKKWDNGGVITVRGPKVAIRFNKSAYDYEYEYLMAGGFFGTVRSVTYNNGLQYIHVSTE